VILLENTKLSISLSIEWIKFLKEVAYNVAGSYIAGYLFYFFSVLIPQSKRLVSIYNVIFEHIRYAKDELKDLSYNVCGSFNIEENGFGLKLAEKKGEDNNEICEEHGKLIAMTMTNIDDFMSFSLANAEHLDNEELSNLCKIKKLVIKLYYKATNFQTYPILMGEKEYKEFINEIREVNILLESIQTSIKKYV
jgi:hypothetical protein